MEIWPAELPSTMPDACQLRGRHGLHSCDLFSCLHRGGAAVKPLSSLNAGRATFRPSGARSTLQRSLKVCGKASGGHSNGACAFSTWSWQLDPTGKPGRSERPSPLHPTRL